MTIRTHVSMRHIERDADGVLRGEVSVTADPWSPKSSLVMSAIFGGNAAVANGVVWMFMAPQVPLWLLLTGSAIGGVVMGGLFLCWDACFYWLRKRAKIRRVFRSIKAGAGLSDSEGVFPRSCSAKGSVDCGS